MTTITYKDKTYTLRDVTFGAWRKLLKQRKEAADAKDEYLLAEALAVWISTVLVITEEEINALNGYEDAVNLLQLVAKEQKLPLQQDARSAEPLSQEIRA